MRGLGLAIALAGVAACGRIGFDPLALDGALRCTPGNGHDEDGDGLTDGCDPCPHVVDGGASDLDGDGVGDACDPFSDTPGDFFVRFEPFTTTPQDWDVTAGTMSDGDALPIDSRGSAWAGSYAMAPVRDVFVLGGTLGERGTATQQVVSVLMFLGPPKYLCEIHETAGTAAIKITYTYDEVDFTIVGETPVPLQTTGRFVMKVEHVLPTIGCTVELGGTNYQVFAQVPLDIPADRVSINVIDEVASLAYFVQIRTGTN